MEVLEDSLKGVVAMPSASGSSLPNSSLWPSDCATESFSFKEQPGTPKVEPLRKDVSVGDEELDCRFVAVRGLPRSIR